VPGVPYKFRVTVFNDPNVNAFALPGGQLVLLRGLIERSKTPEELAGVLAHEMQHVLKRHATRALIQHVSTGLLLAALTGDVMGPVAYGAQSAQVLGQLQYSRRAEVEADAEGMKMLLDARVDPAGTVRFFEGLTGGDKQPRSVLRYLSTHPSTTDRIERLRQDRLDLALGLAALERREHGNPGAVGRVPGLELEIADQKLLVELAG
jgi:predicted Zn-dependent protease